MRLLLAGLVAIVVMSPLDRQTVIPVRRLRITGATDSSLKFEYLNGVRPLSDGRVFVNDLIGHRLYLFDTTMSHFTLIADTSEHASIKYAGGIAAIIPYLGDSTLLVDQNARALIVIAPDGRVARTMSAPKPTDLPQLSLAANAATDPGGRLVYRVNLRRPSSALAQRMDSGQYVKTVMHDSAAIVRADFNSRTVDTVGVEAMPVRVSLRYSAGSGGGAGRPSVNPLPQTDEWAMLADGTIAIVRGQDYHIDWIHPDGTHTSSPKMQFAWRRVTLEEKQRMLDSARRADSASEAAAQRFTAQQAARGAGRGGGLPGLLPYSTVDPPDMPDYYPPIRAGTVFADPDGNLWILPTTSAIVSDALVYDVVDRSGAVVERVLLPPKRKLLAVGHAGVLYLANYSGDYFKIERARVLK